jgi:hypothetical protein
MITVSMIHERQNREEFIVNFNGNIRKSIKFTGNPLPELAGLKSRRLRYLIW